MACVQNQYMSWLMAGLGLKHLKLGLEHFVTKQIEIYHKDLIKNVSSFVSLSLASDIDFAGQTWIKNVNRRTFKPQVFYCDIHKTDDNNTCMLKKCPNAACHKLMNEITKLHRLKKPIWSNTNIDPGQFICDPWEFAKCFLSVSGNHNINSISEVDAAGILGIMINLLPIAKSLKIDDKHIKAESDVLSKCRHARNSIVHSHNYALDEHTMKLYLDLMIDVLKCIPASICTTDAVFNISQLKNGQLSMTEKEEREIRASASTCYRQTKINGWRSEQEYFVSTAATLETIKLLETNPSAVVTGSSGAGKSTIIHILALSLQDKGYNIHIVDEPSHIFQNHNQKNVYVLDDPFGKGTVYREQVLKWEAHLDKLKKVLQIDIENDAAKNRENLPVGKTIILISCRLNIYRNHFVSQIAKALKFQECDLSSVALCLTLSEKQDMFAKYIENVKFESVKCDMDYFPLICMLSRHKEPDAVKKIFENPPKHIREEMESMKHDDALQLQLCCICLCVIFDHGFNLNLLRLWEVDDLTRTSHKNQTHVINSVCKAFKLDLDTLDCSKLLETFCTLNGTYCKEVGDIVVFRHDKILDVAAKICGETFFSTYIAHASTKFIAKRYTLHDSPQVVKNEYLIHIQKSHENKYFSRILKDLTNNQTESFAFNDQLENESFQNKLMKYVEIQNKREIIQTTLHKDSHTIERSLADMKGGFNVFSLFLFKLGLNKDRVLVEVCGCGNTAALEYLLKSCDVNVNTQRKYGEYGWYETPLTAAVFHGDVYNVRLLLQFKADVNLGNDTIRTPLMWAAWSNKKHIVDILLQNNASVTQCDRDGRTALHWCCRYYGAVDINKEECVNLLLQYNADVMHRDIYGKTPVDEAKQCGLTNIVHILQQQATD